MAEVGQSRRLVFGGDGGFACTVKATRVCLLFLVTGKKYGPGRGCGPLEGKPPDVSLQGLPPFKLGRERKGLQG